MYKGSKNYLQRYVQGEHQQVWTELRELGIMIQDPLLMAECKAVAQETMRRVRYNLEILIPGLISMGFHFIARPVQDVDLNASDINHIMEDECILLPQNYDFSNELHALHSQVGLLPLSLIEFYHIIGAVNLIGTCTFWSNCKMLDPLQVHSPKMALIWLNENYEAIDKMNRTLIIAPDAYHKIGMSGGGVYCVSVPNGTMDFLLEDEPHHLSFIEYLRFSLEWGGMPGLADCIEEPDQVIRNLTQNFLSF